MRSVNTAYKLGREIGRDVGDIWLPDEVLRRQVRRVIGPKINLFKSDEDKALEAGTGLLILTAVLSLFALAATVLLILPNSYLETAKPLLTVRTSLESMLGGTPRVLVFGVTAALVLITIMFAIAAAVARKRAAEAYSEAVSALYAAGFKGAMSVLEVRRRKTGMVVETTGRREFLPPSPRPLGVDARGAEEVVAQWMRHLGEADAELTSVTGDGGIDVTGTRSFAQVKHYAKAVGVAPLRELAGVAANDPRGRHPLFFTRTGYARGAVDFANAAGIALYVYDVERGGLEAMNARAKTLVQNGIV